MNDPGLDQPIEQNAQMVESRQTITKSHSQSLSSGEEKARYGNDHERAYLKPSRWWFASTAFPLIAGTFGPMASAFNVCAIATYWRTNIIPPQTENTGGDDIPDPKWLLATNGISLAIAIIANLALLFNMARRISFSVAQPITIIGWYMSGFILVGLVASVHAPSMQLPDNENVYLTQAYYYACLAAGLYIIVATIMVVTVIGAYRKHYSKDFQLTISQRTLMLQTIAYLVYLLSGGAIFARIEGWSFLNGVWWANFTLLTIGIGDYSPTTHTGQSLLFPYAFGGIVILGLVIGSIRSLVLERGQKKIAARIVEKKREKVVDNIDISNGESKIRLGLFAHHHVQVKQDDKREYRRRAEEFQIMRKIQEYADKRKKWTALLISAVSWLTLWLVGAALFYVAERDAQGLTYFEWIYFAYTSLLTIGYGDYTMNSNAGKPIFVFWSLLAIPTLTILISNMGDTVVKGIRDVTLWAGELTILPGEGSTKRKVLNGAKSLKEGQMKRHVNAKRRNEDDDPVEEPPGGVFMAEGARKKDSGRKKRIAGGAITAATDRMGEEFEQEELHTATQAQQKGDKLSRDVHLYHYLLVREIRNVMKDVNEQPPKRYSYHEWAWFMRLLGEDENDARFHSRPTENAGSKHNSPAGYKADGRPGEGGESSAWSWVGINSPLLGTQDEAEWVLERLSQKLEDELKAQSQRRRQGKEEQAPPVTEGSRNEQQAPEEAGDADKEDSDGG